MDQATRSIAKSEISASTHSSSNESLFETGLSKKSVMRDYYEFEGEPRHMNKVLDVKNENWFPFYLLLTIVHTLSFNHCLITV